MSKAFEWNLSSLSMKNESTTTLQAYSWVRLCTTDNSVDWVTTTTTIPMFGVTQTAIDPQESGPIAPCAQGNITRLKMGSTGYTSRELTSTPVMIEANAQSLGIRATTSTCWIGARAMTTWAASDIIPVVLTGVRRAFN